MRLLLACLCLGLAAAPASAQQDEKADDDAAEATDEEAPAEEPAEPAEPAEPLTPEQRIEQLESQLEQMDQQLKQLQGVEARLEELGAVDDQLQEASKRLDKLDMQVNPPVPVRRLDIPKLEVNLGGRVQSDVRFRLQEQRVGSWYGGRILSKGISRNENIAKLKVDASISRFSGVLDLDLVFVGVPDELEEFGGLTDRRLVDPFRVEAHAAYIDARDLFFKGLDLRVGQQKVMWGVGDQFNPTNNLNANDLEDPLLFGEQQANLMLKLDYSPLPVLTFSGVLVPVFRPALLPASAELGLAAVDRLPFTDEAFRYKIHSEQAMAHQTLTYPTVLTSATPHLPETSFRNMQFAFRIGGTLGGQDMAISYYNGFSDFPQPFLNATTLNSSEFCEDDPEWPEQRFGDPPDDEQCVNGRLETEAHLSYPKVQVLGFNFTGEIPRIGLGYRLELGIYFPKRQVMTMYNPAIPLFSEEGEYDYDLDGEPGGDKPEVVSDRGFAKWTLGLDYSIGAHLRINAQWVHGMVDEFGAGDFLYKDGVAVRQGGATGYPLDDPEGRPTLLDCATANQGERCAQEITRPKLADYLVLGFDIPFAWDAALFRIFTIWDLSGYTTTSWDTGSEQRVSVKHGMFSKEGFSAVLYPEFQYNFGQGFELHIGALFQLGKDYTKFGDPAAGGHQVFLRGRYSF